MADLAKLVVRLEATIGQYTQQLDVANQKLTSFETRATSSVDRISKAFSRIITAAVGTQIAGALANLADEYTTLGNKLRLVTSGTANLAVVQNQLFASAQRTRTSFSETVELYSRIARNADQLGLSQRELLGITEAVNQAIIVGGSTSREAAQGVIQFGQALASGVLRGDEFRAVAEQMPRLTRALMDGLNVDIGGLRKMAFAGELTARRVVAAVQSQIPKLAAEFGQLAPTIDQSLAVLRNNVVRVFGEFNKSTGLSSGIAEAIMALSNNIENLAKSLVVATVAVVAFKGALVVQSVVRAAAAFLELYTAVASGRAVLLGSAEAERQRAAAGLASAQAEAARTAQQVAAIDAQIAQAAALAQTTAAMSANNAVIIVNAEGQALVANASRAAAAAAVEEARAEVLRRNAVTAAIEARIAQAAALTQATAATAANTAAIAVNAAGQADVVAAETAALAARRAHTAQTAAAAAANRAELVSVVALSAAQSQQATAAVEGARARAAAAAENVIAARATLAAAKAEMEADLTARFAALELAAAEAELAGATTATVRAEAAAAAAANGLTAARARLAEASVAAGAAEAAAATAVAAGTEAQLALQAQLTVAEASSTAAGNALAAAEARLAATTTEANVATFAQIALEKQRAAAQAQSTAAAAALAAAAAKVAGAGAAAAGGRLAVLSAGVLGLLGPLRGLVALIAANPVTALIAGIAAAIAALVVFSDQIKTSADGVVTLRDTAIAAFQLLAEAVQPLTSAVANAFRTIFDTLSSVFKSIAEFMRPVIDGLKEMVLLIPSVRLVVMAVDAVQKRARQIAMERQKKAFLGELEGHADSIIGEIMGSGSGAAAAPDAAALKKIQDLISSIRQQILAQDQGAVSAMRFRIAQGDLADEFKKLGAAGEAYKIQLIALTREQEASKLREMGKDLTQQIATFDQTAMAALRYRLTIGDLKNTVLDAGKAGKAFVDNLIAQQQALDNLQIAKQMKEINASALELQGSTAEAAAIRFDTQNMMLVKQLTEQNNKAGLEQLNTLRQMTIAQAQFNELQAESERIKSALQIAEEQIQNTLAVGAITELDALQQTSDAREETIGQLDEIVKKQKEIAAGAGKSVPAVVQGAAQAGAAIEKLKAQTDLLGQAAEKNLKESFSSAFADVATGAKSAGDALRSFFDDLNRRILQMASQNIAEQLFGGLSELAGQSNFWGQLGKIGVGLLGGTGSSAGGDIPEVTPTVTKVPVRDSGGRGMAGQPYLIGRGVQPELFVPDRAGTFVPNGGLSMTVHQHFNVVAPGGQVTRQTQSQIAAAGARGLAMANARGN